MKIYFADGGWRGSITIVAENKKHLKQILDHSFYPGFFDDPENYDEHEIKSGLFLACAGDT